MSERVICHTASPEAVQAMMAISAYVANCSIEHSLAELVKIRASQINGCANCLHMHTADARKDGENPDKLAGAEAFLMEGAARSGGEVRPFRLSGS